MNPFPSTLIYFSLWLSIVSGCLGCVIGMWLMILRQRLAGQSVHVAHSLQADALASQEEIKSLLNCLLNINSQVDARVGQHTIRIEEITETLENENDREALIRTAKLLVIANQQLQTDLVTAKSELQQQRELVVSFKHDSNTDALTELLNRRAFNVELNARLDECEREKTTFSLLMIDIDHFKQVNDEHGHLNGDQVLLTVAQCLKNSLQVPASVCRYGGEEFAVILPGITGQTALNIAEYLRQAVENCPAEIGGSKVTVTVSIGVAEAIHGATRSELIQRSDKSLFAAKNTGRNRCCSHDWGGCRPLATSRPCIADTRRPQSA